MKSVDRIDINRKWPIPNWVPMMLLIVAVCGLLIGRCSHRARKDYIQFSNIEVIAATHANIDIKFTARNISEIDFKKKGVLIRVVNEQGDEIASKITTINLTPGESKRFLKVLTKFNIPLRSSEEISEVKIETYSPGLFN